MSVLLSTSTKWFENSENLRVWVASWMMWTRWCLPVKFKSYLTLKISFNKRSLTTLKRLKSVFSQYKRSAPACNLSLKIPNHDWRFFVTFFRHNFWLRILHVLPFYCVFADSSRCDQIYMNRPFWFKFRRLGQREMFYFRTFHFPTFSTSKLTASWPNFFGSKQLENLTLFVSSIEMVAHIYPRFYCDLQ